MPERLEPLISAARIRRRVAALARAIEDDHRGGPLTLVVALKGAAIFAADLMRRIDLPLTVEFIRASSYRDALRSSGAVTLDGAERLDLAGRRVVLVEDIVDSGLTVATLVEALGRKNPASLTVCALIYKHVAGAAPVAVRYKGFDIADAFVVGYGMDYAERYRNLPGICRLVTGAMPA